MVNGVQNEHLNDGWTIISLSGNSFLILGEKRTPPYKTLLAQVGKKLKQRLNHSIRLCLRLLGTRDILIESLIRVRPIDRELRN